MGKEIKSLKMKLRIMLTIMLIVLYGCIALVTNLKSERIISKSGEITNHYEGESTEVYDAYLLINELKLLDDTVLAGCSVKINAPSELVLSFYNASTDAEIQRKEDQSIDIPSEGLKLKVYGIVEGSKYDIEIVPVNAPTGYKSIFDKVVIEIDATTASEITSFVKEITKTVNGETETILGSEDKTAIFTYEEENGKIKLYGNSEEEIYYYISDKNGKTESELEEVDWSLYNKQDKVSIDKNGIIYTKSKYKDGKYSEITSLNVNNVDKLIPSVEVLSIEENDTRDEAIINIRMTDQEATDDYGKSGILGYAITIQETVPASFVPVEGSEAAATGITDNGDYFVWVSDKAGNVNHVPVSVTEISYVQENAVAIILSAPDSSLVGTEYESLSDLMDALNNKGITADSGEVVVQIVDDIKNEPTKINNKNITIDLNGYTVTSRLQESMFDVQSGSLKIVDNKYDIADYVDDTDLASTLKTKYSANSGYGKVYSPNHIAIEIENGAILTLGEDHSTGYTDIEFPNQDTPIIEGNSKGILNHGGTFNYYDGVIYGKMTIDGAITNTPLLYDPTVTETEIQGILKTVLERVSAIEAMIGNTRYATLEKAIEAANNTRGTPDDQIEIDIVVDITKAAPILVDDTKYIKLDLNGLTITNTVADYVIKNSGKLEIIDSTVSDLEDPSTVHGKITNTTYGTIYNEEGGEFTLTTGGIETTYDTGYAIYNNNGKVKINGGSVIGKRCIFPRRGVQRPLCAF